MRDNKAKFALFSATLTEEVYKLASVSLKVSVELMVDESGLTALALRQEFVPVREEASREALLLSMLCRSSPGANSGIYSDHSTGP